MASADLRQELDCSICLNIYTDPVNLPCGHSYCRTCIDRALDTQEGSGYYFCPQCRKRFRSRPTLHKNIALRNILANFVSAQTGLDMSGIRCTYCIHLPVPAVKSCLHCEASLCENHLKVHRKTPEHVLSEPTTSMEKRKCSNHKKILEYYCPADATCICMSCRLDGEHQGHNVKTLDEAASKKKQELRIVLQKLNTEREETDGRAQRLEERRRSVHEKSADLLEKVHVLFTDFRRQMNDLEMKVLMEISRQKEQLSLPLSDVIQKLEKKKDELSRKISHMEKLCTMTDPLTVLQEPETGDSCDTEDGDNEDRESHNKLLHAGGYLDIAEISHTFHNGVSDMMKGVNVLFNIQEASSIVLDVNTAHNYLHISDDLKSVRWSDTKYNRPETPERFQCWQQVLSREMFSSGRHYWDVDVRESEHCRIGMCYPSIERRGIKSLTGRNNKSCGLWRYKDSFYLVHDDEVISILQRMPIDRVRVYLDYEAGQLSFYSLCDPITHLHTFTTTFTEPLHAVLCVREDCVKISEGVRTCGRDN